MIFFLYVHLLKCTKNKKYIDVRTYALMQFIHILYKLYLNASNVPMNTILNRITKY